MGALNLQETRIKDEEFTTNIENAVLNILKKRKATLDELYDELKDHTTFCELARILNHLAGREYSSNEGCWVIRFRNKAYFREKTHVFKSFPDAKPLPKYP